MNDLSGRIIRKSFNGSSESTLRRFIEKGTGIYIYRKRVKKEGKGEERGKIETVFESSQSVCIYAVSRRYITRDTRHRSHLVLSPVECSSSAPFPISWSSTEFCFAIYLDHNGGDERITLSPTPDISFFFLSSRFTNTTCIRCQFLPRFDISFESNALSFFIYRNLTK